MVEVDNVGLYGGIGGASFSDYELDSDLTTGEIIKDSGLILEIGLTYTINRFIFSLALSSVYLSDDTAGSEI